MCKIFILTFICLISIYYITFNKTPLSKKKYTIALITEVYIDKGSEFFNDEGIAKLESGGGKTTQNYVGIFPSNNDTITIYKLNKNSILDSKMFSFWSIQNKNSITFFTSENENIKVNFTDRNNLIVNGDIYVLNEKYYNFLKDKILLEHSILDLAFFLKDGYGEYSNILENLQKNWRNQCVIPNHKILYSKIKNNNEQTEGSSFQYKFYYKYDSKGILTSINSKNRFSKKILSDDLQYRVYNILDFENERSSKSENIFLNKQTLNDSLEINCEHYGLAKTFFYTKYQTELIVKISANKPKNISEICKIFK